MADKLINATPAIGINELKNNVFYKVSEQMAAMMITYNSPSFSSWFSCFSIQKSSVVISYTSSFFFCKIWVIDLQVVLKL